MPAVADDVRPVLDGYWALYRDDDAGWPAARAEWLQMETAARAVLVESLIREVIVQTNNNDIQANERAMKELAILGVDAVPHLIAVGEAGDDILRQQMADILGWIGEPAVGPLLESLTVRGRKNKDDRFRRQKVEALGEIGDERATDLVSFMLANDRDWRTRGAAATALGGIRTPESLRTLVQSMTSEDDSFVLERVAASLGNYPEDSSIESLIAAMQREAARSEIRMAVARACTLSLRRITGERIGNDPSAWRTWWVRNRSTWDAGRPSRGGGA